MAKTTKTDKTDKKPSAKKPKKSEKLDVHSLEGTASDIAYLIGLATQNITQLIQLGLMKKQPNGKFNLVECVSNYCRSMRNRKKESTSGRSELETELTKWKLQNLKIKNRDWRMARDRMVATEMLKTLTEAMSELRESAKLNPALCEVLDGIIEKIGRVDVDAISLAVEGDIEEDDE